MKTLRMAVIVSLLFFYVPFSQADVSELKDALDDNVPLSTKAPIATMPSECSKNWWSQAQENIRRSEYHITWQENTYLPDVPAAYQAPNRAWNLRTYFTPEGIRVIPRCTDRSGWVWELSLTGYGYAGKIDSLNHGEMVVKDNRIEYHRGNLVEWYVNSEIGLEQGFTFKTPPDSDAVGINSEIVLEMEIAGDLTGRFLEEKGAVVFSDNNEKTILNYEKLLAKDAAGKVLTSRMEWNGNHLHLCIETAGATYPITVDPMITGGLSTNANWTAESDQSSAYFGISVSTAGDVNGDGYADVIIGAYMYDNGQTDEGRAYVYHGSASGLDVMPVWTAESNQANAFFGYAVSTAGDVNGDGYADVIVGAYGFDDGQSDVGRAVVYYGSISGLSATPDWTEESDQNNAYFGVSVSTAGDVNGDGYADIIIGANGYDNGQADEGRAFVYLGSPIGLATAPAWMAESNQADAWFGSIVSTAGDINGDGYGDVIVAAPYYNTGQPDVGRVYVFSGSASGLSATAVWTAESDQAEARFGRFASTAGDINGDGYADIIISAPWYNGDGRVFVYHGSAMGLGPNGTPTNADWIAWSGQSASNFGFSISTAGDVNGDGYADIIIGASRYTNGQSEEGRVFVYLGSVSGLGPNGVPANADWTAESDQVNAAFGYSVSTAGDVNGDGYSDIIVGAHLYDKGQTDEGRVFVYHGSASGPSVVACWTAEYDQAGAYFGQSVSTAGDVNGDGYSDVIIGAPNYDNGQTDEGRVFVYHGSAGGLSASPTWMAESNQDNARFGLSISTAGDVNGDGYADIIIGAPCYGTSKDRVFVYHGSDNGLSASPVWMMEFNEDSDWIGLSVSAAGDVNGDGFADIIIGVPGYDNDQANEGRVFVYHGSAGGLSTLPTWTAESDQDDAYFGYSVSSAGDVNGDGYSDVIVGAPYYHSGITHEGGAFVYLGSNTGLLSSPAWIASTQISFGSSVSTAGDVNGDGYSDIIVGAPHYDNDQIYEGRAFVYLGSAEGLNGDPAWTAESDQEDADFGFSVSLAGDVNNDGYTDVIVGANWYDNGQIDEGRAYVYLGSPSGLAASHAWTAESNQAYACFGCSVSTAGDVNGDGYSDIIIGAPGYDNDQFGEGRVYVYYGNGGAGLSLAPRQLQTDGITPVSHLGKCDEDSFLLALRGLSPFGRGKVKLEWEVKPFGVPFDGMATEQSPSWVDTGSAGAQLNGLVSGLSHYEIYHWRVRLLYHPATTPFQQYSRWITMPRNGWEEADLRTAWQTLYYLSTIEDWQNLMAAPNIWKLDFILANDLDMTGIAITPVGDSTTHFTGTFDGGGHVVRNVTINQPSDIYIGLFGHVGANGQIHDLGIEDVNINARAYVGGLVGYNSYGMISNCYTTGAVSGSASHIGGLVSMNDSGTISHCYSTATVTGSYYDHVGGLVGDDYAGVISDCFAIGNVTGYEQVGGLIGGCAHNNISNCYATGDVNGSYYVGGLMGRTYVGVISNCYSIGEINGIDIVGGLVGNNNNGTFSACFWDTQTSGTTSGVGVGSTVGITGQTTSQMQTQSTFTDAGWDYVVEMDNGYMDIWYQLTADYPRLWWQYPLSQDVDFSGVVEVPDMTKLSEEWLLENGVIPNYRLKCDFDQDGFVDLIDFAQLAEHWLEGL